MVFLNPTVIHGKYGESMENMMINPWYSMVMFPRCSPLMADPEPRFPSAAPRAKEIYDEAEPGRAIRGFP